MSIILDSNVCIDVLRGRKQVITRLAAHSPKDCYISVITEFELIQGANRAPEDRRSEEREKVARLISCLQILPFDRRCAQMAAEVNAELLNRGTPVSVTDVFIAATGLAYGWPVVTNNTKDFAKIRGLSLEDWRG